MVHSTRHVAPVFDRLHLILDPVDEEAR